MSLESEYSKHNLINKVDGKLPRGIAYMPYHVGWFTEPGLRLNVYVEAIWHGWDYELIVMQIPLNIDFSDCWDYVARRILEAYYVRRG